MADKTNIQKAFPDYVLDFTPPAEWVDESWRHNACPSWIFYKEDMAYRLWADYKEEAQRDNPTGRRFVICEYRREGDEWLRDVYATGDAAEARHVCYLIRVGRYPL